MPSEETVLTCLQSVLCNHRERGTLLEKTPRELRIEVAQSLGLNAQDIDKHKDALKAEISKYISQMGPPKIEKKLMKLRSPKPEIRKLKERMNRRRVKPASPSSDSSFQLVVVMTAIAAQLPLRRCDPWRRCWGYLHHSGKN
jgi:ribosome maturation protein Sdo1